MGLCYPRWWYEELGAEVEADESYRRSLELVRANSEIWRLEVVVRNFAKFLRSQGREVDAQELERGLVQA
jgi:Tfp pilus assembly protein PilF